MMSISNDSVGRIQPQQNFAPVQTEAKTATHNGRTYTQGGTGSNTESVVDQLGQFFIEPLADYEEPEGPANNRDRNETYSPMPSVSREASRRGTEESIQESPTPLLPDYEEPEGPVNNRDRYESFSPMPAIDKGSSRRSSEEINRSRSSSESSHTFTVGAPSASDSKVELVWQMNLQEAKPAVEEKLPPVPTRAPPQRKSEEERLPPVPSRAPPQRTPQSRSRSHAISENQSTLQKEVLNTRSDVSVLSQFTSFVRKTSDAAKQAFQEISTPERKSTRKPSFSSIPVKDSIPTRITDTLFSGLLFVSATLDRLTDRIKSLGPGEK